MVPGGASFAGVEAVRALGCLGPRVRGRDCGDKVEAGRVDKADVPGLCPRVVVGSKSAFLHFVFAF